MSTEDVWRKICWNLQDLEELRYSIAAISETKKYLILQMKLQCSEEKVEKFIYKWFN